MNKIRNKKLTILYMCITLLSIPSLVLANSSVWKISKNNDHIFLGGTLHILPENEFPLPTEFLSAYNKTNTIVLEAQLPDPNDKAAQQAMLNQLSYANNENLTQKITPETFALLANYFNTIGRDINQFTSFKPGFVVSIMAIIELQLAGISGEGVDAFFETLATKDKKRIDFLETANMQFALLSHLGEGYEDEFFLGNVELNASFIEFFQLTLDAWRVGDAKRLESLINSAALESDKKSYDALFTHRNKNWIPKIEALFGNKDKEFVLVGAGHLFGKEGLIKLLKDKGYTVEQTSS